MFICSYLGVGNWSKLTVWGFILSLIAFMFMFLEFSIIIAVTAIVLCAVGLKKISKNKQKGKGLAIAGIILASLALLVAYQLDTSSSGELSGFLDNGDAPETKLSIEKIKSSADSFLTYDELMRNNNQYVGRIVKYRGEITQVVEDYGNSYTLRVATKEEAYIGYYDDVLLVNYNGPRLLEQDIIDLWGEVSGLRSYVAVLGNTITIPEIDALHVEIVKKAGDRSGW